MPAATFPSVTRNAAAAAAITALALAGCGSSPETPPAGAPAKTAETTTVRLGYFPNITHAQPLLGVPRGTYAKALGEGVKVEPSTFNAGPSVIEALFGGRLDIAYVGPSPTINGFLKSKGAEVRVIAGSAVNGILVVANAKRTGIAKLEDLKGKKIATPQLGNTQDISARHYLFHTLGAKSKEEGGDTEVINLANPDIEILFEKDQIDAAWVPEPWGSRLVRKGLAKVIAEEKDLWPTKSFALTNVIARAEFLEKRPDLVKAFLTAHVALTAELQAKGAELAPELNTELKRITNKELPRDVIVDALGYTGFTTDPAVESFQAFFEKGKALGFLKGDKLDVDGLFKTAILEGVKAAAPPVPGAADPATSGVAPR